MARNHGHDLFYFFVINLHITLTWAYGKEKVRGAERNLPDFFRLCPSCQKHFPEKLSKIVADGGGEECLRKIPIR